MVAHHFTVDVEEYFHSSALEQLIPSERWDGLNRRAPFLVRRLLDRMDDHGVRGTFFVLGWLARHEPDLVKEIAKTAHIVQIDGAQDPMCPTGGLLATDNPEDHEGFQTALFRSLRSMPSPPETGGSQSCETGNFVFGASTQAK